MQHFRVENPVFAVVFTMEADMYDALAPVIQTLHHLLIEEFHIVLTVEMISRRWHCRIETCCQ